MSVQYPIPAAIAVVFRGDDVLLVRRANPPDAGRWGFPGGKIERGETIMRAAERELVEETSIVGNAKRVFTAVDAFERSSAGAVLHHFILVAVLCDVNMSRVFRTRRTMRPRQNGLLCTSLGMARISLDFSATFTWPSTSR
jgi:ADP-ribose pyrophosphatase YjhB (NUDIX family)